MGAGVLADSPRWLLRPPRGRHVPDSGRLPVPVLRQRQGRRQEGEGLLEGPHFASESSCIALVIAIVRRRTSLMH
eukprot:7480003-Alexandrium_andersonii.AAC.1